MKKFAIVAFAALLVAAFTVPASALNADFGGYWRTRAYADRNFNGTDNKAADITRTDTRTRLYFTAKINDNLKFVNKFEYDAIWGGPDVAKTVSTPTGTTSIIGISTGGTGSSYGDIGADGVAIEIKNSYADFNLGQVYFQIGAQGWDLARGFIFSDDFMGIRMNIKSGSTWAVPLYWMKAYEGGQGKDQNKKDVDIYAIAPEFKLTNEFWLNPYFMYLYSDNATGFAPFFDNGNAQGLAVSKLQLFFAGFDADYKAKDFSLWGTFIYEGGKADTATDGHNVNAWTVAAGGMYNFGPMDVHGRGFYVSGQSQDDIAGGTLKADKDLTAFFVPRGQSYYWAEIMGYGIFDNQVTSGSPADKLSNIVAGSVGLGFKPLEKLSLSLDVWTASLAEKNAAGDSLLGTEVDLTATYQVLKNLNLDVVGAWMARGDATYKGAGEKDPYEIGTRLSLSF